MDKNILIIVVFVVGILAGGSLGYGISSLRADELDRKIEDLDSGISSFNEYISRLEVKIENLSENFDEILKILGSIKNQSYQNQSTYKNNAEKFDWLSGLLYDLQTDSTDKNQKNGYSYDDEHFARDLENSLESRGYNVSLIVAFYMSQNLSWDIVLKVTKSNDYYILVNPQTDSIVTYIYDGNRNGIVETIKNPNLSTVSFWMKKLVNTTFGNDGKYLLFEFDDYESIKLADTRVYQTYEKLMKDLSEDKTDQQEYIEDTHDCDDFAKELEDALEKKGYRVTVKLVYWIENGKLRGHAINDVYLKDGKKVTIEPQTDEDVSSEYDNDKDGEVETAWDVGKIRLNIWLTGFEYWGRWPTSGTDGKYLIFEYEDFDDIPIDLD